MILYFDTLQDYNNDGTTNTLNLIEQEDELKTIAKDYMANLIEVIGVKKYNIGNISNPKYVVRSNLHNQKLITWEVSFNFTYTAPCTESQYQIDLSLLPDTIEETDIERGGSVVDACLALLANLSEDQKNVCILPNYDFSDVDVQSNVTPAQQTDLKDWLCTGAPGIPSSIIFNGVDSYINLNNIGAYSAFEYNTPWSFTTSVKINDVTGLDIIVGKRNDFFYGIVFFVNAGKLSLQLRDSVTGTTRLQIDVLSTGMVNNTWTKLGFSLDGSSSASGAKLYINGISMAFNIVQDNLANSIATPNDLMIGQSGGGNFLGGNVGYSRFWSTELSPAEMLTDYNGGPMLEDAISSSNLVVGWKSGQDALFGSVSYVFPDETGNNTNPSIFAENLLFSSKSTDVPT
jgi:hypothetical protein